jgi:hypothetical protein
LRISFFEGSRARLPLKRVIVGPARSQEKLAEKVKIARALVEKGVPVDRSNTPWIPPVGGMPVQEGCTFARWLGAFRPF